MDDKKPSRELQAQAEHFYAKQRELVHLKEEVDDLRNALACQMYQEDVATLYTREGIGYDRSVNRRVEYQPSVFAYLKGRGLLESFRPEPKITKKAMKPLIELGLMTQRDVEYLDQHSIVTEEITVRQQSTAKAEEAADVVE